MGSGGSVVVGYRYIVKMILGLVTGQVDEVRGAKFEKRNLPMSAISNEVTVSVDAPNLFGGEGKGGIVADLTLADGNQAQVLDFPLRSEPLFSQLKGVSAVLFDGGIGNIPYLNDMLFSVQRIYKRENSDQWYPEKAAVPLGELQILIPPNAVWEYRISIDPAHYAEGVLPENLPALPQTAVNSAQGPFGNNAVWPVEHITANDLWPRQTALILQKTLIFNGIYDIRFTISKVENSCVGYLDGVKIFEVNADNSQIINGPGFSGVTTIPKEIASAGSHSLVIWCRDEPEDFEEGDVTHVEIEIAYEQIENAMNPAHIIREILTEPWGLNLPESEIDNESFTAAADTLFADGFGLCLTLSKDQTLEAFLHEILSTADMVLSQNQDGKWKLTLVREDYVIEELPIFDESNIFNVTQYSEPGIQSLAGSVVVTYVDYKTGDSKLVTAVNSAVRQQLISDVQVSRNYRGLPTQKLATVVALRDLRVLSTPLSNVAFTTNLLCYPGQVIKFNWSAYSVEKTLRVLNVGIPDDNSGVFTVVCVEEGFSTPLIADIEIPDTSVPGANPNTMPNRLIVETNYYILCLVFGQFQVDQTLASNPDIGRIMTVCKKQTAQIDAHLYSFDTVWVDRGAVNFTKYGTLNSAATKYEFELNLTTDTPLVVGDLIFIDEEILMFEIEPSTFKRGMFDSIPANHVNGSEVFTVFNYTISSNQRLAGELVDYTLCGNTGSVILNPQLGIITTVAFNSVAIRPYSPGNVKVNGEYEPTTTVVGEFVISWSNRNRTMTTTEPSWYSSNQTPESGQQTKISVWVNSVFYQDYVVEGTETELTINPPTSGTLSFEICSVRDGYYSLHNYSQNFAYEFVATDTYFANAIIPKIKHWLPLNETSTSETLLDLIGGMEFAYSGSGVILNSAPLHGSDPSILFDTGYYYTRGISQWMLNGARNLGVTVWLKPTVTSFSSFRDIVVHSEPGDLTPDTNYAHQFRLKAINNSLEEFHERDTGLDVLTQASTEQLALVPNHVTVFVDGTNKKLHQSINAGDFASASFSHISTGGNDTSAFYCIGKNRVTATATKAYMQDLMYFKSLLTVEENAWLYNDGDGRTYDEFRGYLSTPLTWSPSNLRNKIVWASSDNADNVVTSGRVTLIANKVGHSSAQVVSNSTNEFRSDLSTLNGKPVFIGQAGYSGRYRFMNTNNFTNTTTGFTIAVLTKTVEEELVADVIKHVVTIPASNLTNLVSLSRNGVTPVNNFYAECKRDYTETSGSGRDTYNHTTNWRIVLLNVNYTTGVADLRVNGSVETNIGLTTGVGNTNNSPYVVSIGGNAYDSVSENLNYGLAELVVLNRPCTIPELEKLEGFLAHKWGMASQLVEGHTWRLEPPAI